MGFPKRELEGRDHVVVPAVLAVEGVLNGNNGPLFYTADELEKTAHLWNGRPVVVYHPSMQNGGGTANQPTVYSRQRIGTLFNARMEGSKLKAEAWLDPSRLSVVDHRVMTAVSKGQMVEVSTGLFLESDERPGSFCGVAYDGIAKNFQPDHLAILPDSVGACSISDGAGLCRNQGKMIEPLAVPTWA